MPDKPDDDYDVDEAAEHPAAHGDGSTSRQPLGRGIPRPEEVEPLKVEGEDDEPPRTQSVRDLDVCPSCGGSMRGGDNLVCIRCGFDLKTNKKVQTVTGAVEVGDEPATGELEPIIKPGNGDLWLPAILAAISGVILLIGYLAGAPALYPHLVADAALKEQALVISAGQRLQAVLQLIVLVGMLKACGLGALTFTAYMNGMRLCRNWDHLKLGAMRMGAIAVTMRLAAFIALPQMIERLTEAVVQLAVFTGLSIALFGLKPKDAPILTGAMAILFVLLWLSAWVIVWGTW